MPAESGLQRLGGAVGFQCLLVDDLDPAPVRDDDLFIAETPQTAGGAYPGYCKNLSDAFLRQVNASAFSGGRIPGEKVQQVAESDKGTVVILMSTLIQEQVDIGRIPVQCAEHELRVFCQHLKKVVTGKAECLHLGDRHCSDGLLYLEDRTMAAGKHRPFAVKRGNLAGTVLMFQRGPGYAGEDIEDMCYGFSVIPQVFIFSKCPYSVRLSAKIFLEIYKVIGKIIAGDQHVCHLHSLKISSNCFHHITENERLQSRERMVSV